MSRWRMSICFKYEGWLYHWTSTRHRTGWKVLGEQRNSRLLCSFILVSQKAGKLWNTLQQLSCNEQTHNYLIEVCREEIGDPCGEGWEDGPDTRAPCRTGTVLTGAQLPAHHPLTTPSRPPHYSLHSTHYHCLALCYCVSADLLFWELTTPPLPTSQHNPSFYTFSPVFSSLYTFIP